MASSPMTFGKTLLAAILAFFIVSVIVGVVLVGSIVAIITSSLETEKAAIPESTILKVDLSGGLLEHSQGGLFSGLTDEGSEMTLYRFDEVMRHAAEDSRIKGIVLDVAGYTGGFAQAEEIRRSIGRFRKEKKFVYAVSDPAGYNESTYNLATACDTIIAHPMAELEMNGVYAELSFYRPMLERLGVRAQVVRAGAYKSAVEPFILDSASTENKEMMTSILGSLFKRFTNAVESTRKIPAAGIEAVLNDRGTLSATESRAEGFVDLVAYDDEVTDLLRRRSGIDSSQKVSTISLTEYARDVVDKRSNTGSVNQVAVVYVVGSMTTGKSRYSPSPMFGGEMVGSETFAESMREARDNNNIKVVVLRIDSPGGDATAADAMWREVKLCAAKKPVIVSMGRVAASGGYYIAAAADTIIADSTTITGSIGVFGLSFNTHKLFTETIGINNQIIRTHPHADVSAGDRDMTEPERLTMERRVDSIYLRFVRLVADGRGLSTDSVNSIAQGRVWTGEQAHQVGLVDILGGLDRAIEIAVERAKLPKDAYSIRILPQPKSWLESFAERLENGSRVLSDAGRRNALTEIESIIDAIRSRSGVQARMIDWQLR